MALILMCRDIGADCDHVVRGETEEEIFRKFTEHLRSAHGMKEIPGNLYDRVYFFIRVESKGETRLLQQEAA